MKKIDFKKVSTGFNLLLIIHFMMILTEVIIVSSLIIGIDNDNTRDILLLSYLIIGGILFITHRILRKAFFGKGDEILKQYTEEIK